MFVWKGKFVSFEGQQWIINEILGNDVTLIRYVERMPLERQVSLTQLDGGGSWARRGLVG
ncbi:MULTISPECIES: hypothetical protein [Brevibacillus]|uniref:hypothetical protein n=1 Tax=Brevibacillus TaxID=55080 RepID=UPI000D0F0E78|nr:MULTISPECIES: hypothetical protein [Brevibacillus]PSJ66946.1 hypothetical protein C7J99_22950 [Brevibacillus brevis]RED27779.1 hypothetical protein DES34_10971 [Brevibacillus brevis]TQK42145.1 hypothetical protein FB479_115137 [Brevibacillus sp. AG162]VEF86817.1 Uncharacterised protein [Brevibacillus brevis]GEC88619.1 hypothetical protein BBR01nite_09500 [Brevibacillus brevis]